MCWIFQVNRWKNVKHILDSVTFHLKIVRNRLEPFVRKEILWQFFCIEWQFRNSFVLNSFFTLFEFFWRYFWVLMCMVTNVNRSMRKKSFLPDIYTCICQERKSDTFQYIVVQYLKLSNLINNFCQDHDFHCTLAELYELFQTQNHDIIQQFN